MAKYCGDIGFAICSETEQDVYKNVFTVKKYYGDVIKLTRRNTGSEKINDDITLSLQISIIADPFLNDNITSIKYITYMDKKWKISSIDFNYPRLVLTLGGLYNE